MKLAISKRAPRAIGVYFALLFAVFAFVYPYNTDVNNPNENVRVFMTMAIVEHGTFVIDEVVKRSPRGWVNDMAKMDDPVTHETRHYSVKGPALGYLGVPVYWAFTKLAPRFGHPVPTMESPQEQKVWWMRASTFVLRIFIVQLPCFLFLVWFERWLRGTTSDVLLRLCAVTAAGLGTNYLAYSLMFVSHALFAVVTFMSFGIILKERLLYPDPKQRRFSRALAAGLLAGFASLLDYQAFILSTGLALYALTTFWRPTRLLAFGLGAAVNAAALTFYQYECYGDPLTPGHKHVENPQFAAWHAKGFFGLEAPNFEVFRDLSLSHTYGFFGTSPFMWLGLLAIPFGIFWGYGLARERHARRLGTAVWVLMMFALWFAISCAVNWRGGWTVGPRFFGCAPPFFAYGAVCALEWLARRRTFALPYPGVVRGPDGVSAFAVRALRVTGPDVSRVYRALARGLAGGLALASVVQTGFISLLWNTIPEDVTRPLPQLAIPLARAGFVPHHAGELLGWSSPWIWYGVAACGVAAALLAALLPQRDERAWAYLIRGLVVPGVCALGLLPAFSEPTKDDRVGVTDTDAKVRSYLADIWEPKDRDFIATLRVDAERYGSRRACNWFRLADLERLVDHKTQADQDEQRAKIPRSECP